jgi:hypothetical protein
MTRGRDRIRDHVGRGNSVAKLIVIGAIAVLGMAFGAGTAPAAISSLTIDPRARLSRDGTEATLSGTITCDSGDTVTLSGFVTEVIGRLVRGATNFGGVSVTCTGDVQTWSLTAVASTIKLLPGPASTQVGAVDTTDFSFANVFSTVLLKP